MGWVGAAVGELRTLTARLHRAMRWEFCPACRTHIPPGGHRVAGPPWYARVPANPPTVDHSVDLYTGVRGTRYPVGHPD